MPTLTVSAVLVIAYYIAMSAFGIAVSDMKPFFAFLVFFVIPILLLPLAVWFVSDALTFAKASEQLTRSLRDSGFHPSDRIDVPGCVLLIDRRQRLLCIAYNDTVATGKPEFSTFIYSAKHLLSCDVEQDADVVTSSSATTRTRTDRLRRTWFNDPNATIAETTFNTTQTDLVKSLTLKILVDDERRPSHRIDFFRSLQGKDSALPEVRQRINDICTWEILVELLIAGQAIPAFGSLTELRDRIEVMKLKGEPRDFEGQPGA